MERYQHKLEYCPDADACEHHKKESCYDGTYEQCKVYINRHPKKLSLTERVAKKLGIEHNLQL